MTKKGDAIDRNLADTLLKSLSDGITNLLGIRETVSSGGQRPPNQTMATAAFDLAKITKQVVTLLS
jgi:hypothetical protein